VSSIGPENRRKGLGAAQCRIGHTHRGRVAGSAEGGYDGSAASRCPVPMLGTSRGRLGVDAEPQKCDLGSAEIGIHEAQA